jgi:hypothetical protein
MPPSVASNEFDWRQTDVRTRERVGELMAYGVLETQVADALLLDVSMVVAIKESPEYKRAFSRVSSEKMQLRIDVERGWDAVEERALENVLKSLNNARDPNFSLAAARVANVAKRRVAAEAPPRVLDAEKGANIIVLEMNRTYIQATQREGRNVIDVTPPQQGQIEQKKTDLIPPGQLEKLLGQPKAKKSTRDISDLQAEMVGNVLARMGIKNFDMPPEQEDE